MEYLSFLLHQLRSSFNQYSILALLLPLFLSYMLLITWRSCRNSTPKLPPGPWTLPIIGNLHQLGTSPLHRSLHLLSLKHGPLMLLKLGRFPVCVISSAKLAEEVMKVHDLTFADRPELASSLVLSYGGSDIAFQCYGETWRQLKKMTILQLLSSKKMSSFKSVRGEEVGLLLQAISTTSGPVNLSELLVSVASSIVCRVALGEKYSQGEGGYGKSRFQDTLVTFQALLAAFCVGDFFPYLKWVDWLTGLHGKLQSNFRELDRFYDDVIRDHIDPQGRLKQQDFVHSLLDAQKNGSLNIFLSGNNIKGMLMNIFIGGTDTMSATLVWAMAELMRKPKAMKRLQDEIRSTMNVKDMVEENDLHQLQYLKLVIKETLRLHPPAPLLLPRVSSRECNVGGYFIPAKTRVLVNAWAIGRDPNSWRSPEAFIPERFVGSDLDYKGQNFEFIPFGSGRRMCPGIHFATEVVELVLANLIYCFDWELPCGKLLEDIDMIEAPGTTVHKRHALLLVAKQFAPSNK